MRVGRDIGDAIALPDAERLQCRRPAVAAFEELAEGEPQVAVDRLAVRVEPPAPREIQGLSAISILRSSMLVVSSRDLAREEDRQAEERPPAPPAVSRSMRRVERRRDGRPARREFCSAAMARDHAPPRVDAPPASMSSFIRRRSTSLEIDLLALQQFQIFGEDRALHSQIVAVSLASSV